MFFKNRDAYERQAEERDLADTYIDDLILKLTDPEAYEKKVQEEAKEKAEQLPAQIPQLKKLEVRLNSPSADPTNYEFALICDFETMDDLNTYQVHPAHVAFGQFIKPLREARALPCPLASR